MGTGSMSRVSEPAPAGAPAPLRTPLLGFAALVFVVAASWFARPAPGDHGRSLLVAIDLVVLVAATVGVLRFATAPRIVQVSLMLAAIASAAALIALQHKGIGLLGVFPSVTAAALRFPLRLSAVVAGFALVAVALASSLGAHWPVTATLLDEFAVVAFFVMAVFARRLRESEEQTRVLLVEVERSRAAHVEAAALAERQRLAREMHDVLAHSLSGLVLNLESARLLTARSGSSPEVADAIERARRLARAGVEEARGAIAMLRDGELPGPERLAGLASGFTEDTGVPCDLSVDGEERQLGSDARLTLYRVAQEALTNVRKHANPDRVEIRLRFEPAGTRLVVEDVERDGVRPLPRDGTGYGLTGMRERAELIDGTLTAASTEDGFRVELWVPA